MPLETYLTIGNTSKSEFKDRGSRFIAYAYQVNNANEIQTYIHAVKEQHPKAVHHCYAYRLGTDKYNWRAYDDGEPSGSAGKPILGQIDSFGLTNILIVVVRYFGGTLLGVPGLINAYKSVARMALQETTIIHKHVEQACLIRCSYDNQFEVIKLLKQRHIDFKFDSSSNEALFKVSIPVGLMPEITSCIGDFTIIELL
jgi:uncharacterized YigZ family protein